MVFVRRKQLEREIQKGEAKTGEKTQRFGGQDLFNTGKGNPNNPNSIFAVFWTRKNF